MSESMFDSNIEAVEAWNTVLFDKFLRFRPLVTGGLEKHSAALLERYPPRLGSRVIDLGCGFGDTTLELARRVGPEGEAVGVDAAARFIDVARADAEAAGVRNVSFRAADVQSDPLGGPYGYAFSRFGTMFFASPVAALRNVRKSLSPQGTLAMVVWRRKDENAWLYEVEQRVLEIVPHPEKKADQVTCGPGPFSMASPDPVSNQLRAAGFERITFERLDVDICMGKDVDEAIELAMALGPAGEILRLAGAEAERHRPEVVRALRELMQGRARKEGVFGNSSSWLVSARAAD